MNKPAGEAGFRKAGEAMRELAPGGTRFYFGASTMTT